LILATTSSFSFAKNRGPKLSDEERKVRSEQEIFEELSVVCTTPGFIHVIGMFCFRDNIIRYRDKMTAEDYSKLFSPNRLIRTEISTLIGLLVRAQIERNLPSPDELERLLLKSEALLAELHEAMTEPFKRNIGLAFERSRAEVSHSPDSRPSEPDPFETAEAMREPIFYGPESAYSFQYRDLAPMKYEHDETWTRSKQGFFDQ
jgi:hypothetical protein